MCRRPWADHPAADGTAAHDRREASLSRESAGPLSLQVRRPHENTNVERKHLKVA